MTKIGTVRLRPFLLVKLFNLGPFLKVLKVPSNTLALLVHSHFDFLGFEHLLGVILLVPLSLLLFLLHHSHRHTIEILRCNKQRIILLSDHLVYAFLPLEDKVFGVFEFSLEAFYVGFLETIVR